MSTKQTFTTVKTMLVVITLSLATNCFAQTNVTPAQYLAMQPKPNFVPGYHLPPLTRWGWVLSSNACVELANNWGYCLPIDNYVTPAIASNSLVAGTFDHGMLLMVSNNPSKYKLCVILDRNFTNPPNSFYCTNSGGWFVDSQLNWCQYTNVSGYSGWVSNGMVYATNPATLGAAPGYLEVVPNGPYSYWTNITAYWMNSLRTIQSNAPISMILNGGEYGQDVAGSGEPSWNEDVRVRAIFGTNLDSGTTKFGSNEVQNFSTTNKGWQLGLLTTAIKQQLPNRQLYIFYNTGREQNRYTYFTDWSDGVGWWGWNAENMVTNSDLPSFEDYYEGYSGWLSITNPFPNDILTRHLNAVGYYIKLGSPLNYSWVCGGWDQGNGAEDFSPIPLYFGFLKCLYTAGMVGGIAGYFAYPSGTNYNDGGPGFDATFPTNSPPMWLQQIVALARVHALFSHYENFLTNGDLLSGPQCHEMSTDQPAYEFTNNAGYANDRVLARELRGTNQWLICAWASDGVNTNVTVTIPTLGSVMVLARDSGAVYLASTTNLTLVDLNGVLPTETPQPPNGLQVLTGP